MATSRRFRKHKRSPQPGGPPRLVGGVIGAAFAGIGLSLIGSLWMQRGLGEPPVSFKIFGTLVAIPFVAIGSQILYSALRGKPSQPASSDSLTQPPLTRTTGYACPACGARLSEAADVSPMGDVKCAYCKQWFNIHG